MSNNKINEHSLCVYRNSELIFSHDGKWLHPLFELEIFLSGTSIDPGDLKIDDKIVGKAAAMLMVRLGLKKVHARTLSEPALKVFRQFNVEISHDKLVPLIECQTEKILANIDEPEEASVFLLRRGKRDVDAALIIESLYVSRGERPVLVNLSFAVTRGEKVIIRGGNGSGKSTLLQTVLGEIRKTSGLIEISGKPADTYTTETLGYLGQYTAEGDISITAGEVVALGGLRWRRNNSERKHRMSEAVELTQIADLLSRPMNTLSGGERRRVDLARCFFQAPQLLMLDEPTANLDQKSRDDVIRALSDYASLNRGAIVMVSHDSSAFDLHGWRYHELKDGRLVPLSVTKE